MMKKLKFFLAASALVLLVAGCGGGGGNASSTNSTTATTTTTTTDKTTSTTANAVTASVVNTAGTVVNSISYGGGQRIKAQYATAAGVAIPYTLVSFSITTNAAAASLSQTTALTDASGVAYVSINPATAATVGAATVKATAGTVSTSLDFGISATSVSLGSLVLGSSSLSSGGTTSVGTTATANSALASGVSVAFSATCGVLTPSIVQTDGYGVASSSYSAIKSDGSVCSGPVTVSAVASGSTQINTLTVDAPVASAVNLQSVNPTQIYVQGAGATTQSIVTFKVLNASGGAYSGASVTVSLTANPGGVGLNASGVTTPLTLISDSSGLVTFTVFSGTIPGPLEVKAVLADGMTYAVSKTLTVQSGPPSQKFFSMAADSYNIEGKNWQGTTATLTVQAADRTGNPVPAGTVVNFIAQGGQVSPSCTMALIKGIASCQATFSSQTPRPTNMRIAVLAYTEGVKDFTDSNGNNSFDAGETLVNMGDAYRDDNENGAYDAGEFTVSRGGSDLCDGGGAPTPSRADTCTGVLATTVRRQVMLIMSGSTALFNSADTSSTKISFTLTDDGGINPMPAGTIITPTAIDKTDNSLTCTATAYPATVLSTATSEGTKVVVNLTDCASKDQVSVVVTTPRLVVTTAIFTIP